jgi:hypothetical protein
LIGYKGLGLLGSVCAFSGCAPALSSFTPAHVAPHKHVQAEAGFDVSAPLGTIRDVIEQGEKLGNAARDRELNEQEQAELFHAGAGLALNPPSVVSHLGIAYGLVERFEVGGRLTPGAWRLGGRYQLLDQTKDGLDGTFGLGGGRYSYEFPLSDQIPFIKLEDFSRWQVDLSFLIGKRGNWYRVWAGPRAMFSFYGTELVFEQPQVPGATEEKVVLASLDGSGTYLGGQAGVALGYKKVFLGFELTLAKFWSHPELRFLDYRRDVELESFIVYPGIALMLEL